jgi:RNA polymerase sigma-70 factor (ECF subfamily)
MASVASLHNRRVFSGDIDWVAIAAVYDRLIIQRPTAGIAVARAAAHLEAGQPHIAARALGAIDQGLVDRYQPYWTVLAEVSAALDRSEATDAARTRALELTSDPAVRRHLANRWDPGASSG